MPLSLAQIQIKVLVSFSLFSSLLSLTTGVRQGELLNLEWRHIDFEHKLAFIKETKNGHPRSIALCDPAIQELYHLAVGGAVASTAGKVAEATGVVNGIKTGGNLLANGATAISAQTVSVLFDRNYRANCKSVMQDFGCLRDASLSLVAGMIAVAALGFMLYAVNCSRPCRHEIKNN